MTGRLNFKINLINKVYESKKFIIECTVYVGTECFISSCSDDDGQSWDDSGSRLNYLMS